jgi:predicted RNA binding protein YcfA (HicA-like mRNA interferase family)
MTKTAKLYAQLLATRKVTLTFRDFERLLLAFGFALARQSGSHRVYIHPACSRPIIVQPRGADAKPYQVREFLDMIEAFRLTLDDR